MQPTIFSVEEVRRDFEMIPLADINEADLVGRNEREIQEMAESIQMKGQIVSIVVARYSDGHIRVVDGVKRVLARRKLGLLTVPAEVFPEAEKIDMTLWPIICNRLHSSNTLAEFTAIMTRVKEGATIQDLVRETCLPVGTIKKLMKLHGLEDAFIKAIESGQMSVSTAYKVVRLSPRTRQPLIAVINEGKRISAHDVRVETSVQNSQRHAQINAQMTFVPKEDKKPETQTVYIYINGSTTTVFQTLTEAMNIKGLDELTGATPLIYRAELIQE